INVVPVGAVTVSQQGEVLADIEGMAAAGALAVSEDGKSVMNPLVYKEGMKKAAQLGLVVLAHCEDRGLLAGGVMNAGKKAQELGLPGITNSVEDVVVARDILLAKETGAKLHLCHCSTADSVALVRMGKELGVKLSAEVCPHHFAMTEDEIPGDDANYKMNPPLRTRADADALIAGLADGTMEVIATDHAPHSAEEKKKSFLEAPFGIVGSETAFALSYTVLVKGGHLSFRQLVEKLSANPARILGIDRGDISVGHIADLVIADVEEPYVIDVGHFISKGKNSPFQGRTVYGKVLLTMVNGEVVYEKNVKETEGL
ncbi:MAG: dihydroorotase, partial [Lachnospiraceae bacterium]|nr:dihydroorotase [Lachnospiraceae bacterium]